MLRRHCSQILRRSPNRPPDMRGGAVVEAEAFFRLAEIPADDVDEGIEADLRRVIERIDVVQRDLPRGHVPFVIAIFFIVALDVVVGHIVRAEMVDIHLRVFIADRVIGEEAQRLMRLDRPGDFLIDIRLDHRRGPIAVIALDEHIDGDVVEEAGEDRLFRHAGLEGMGCALDHMVGAVGAVFEEIDQRRLGRHRGQAGVVADQEMLAGFLGEAEPHAQRTQLAIHHVVERRLGDQHVELFALFAFQFVGAFIHRHRFGHPTVPRAIHQSRMIEA